MSHVIVTTAASVTKLIDSPPNILNDAVLNAVLANNPIGPSIVADYNYGFNHAVGNKFFTYGKYVYVNGIPSSTFVNGMPDDVDDLLLQAINTEIVRKDPLADLAEVIKSSVLSAAKMNFLIYEFFQNNAEWGIYIPGEDLLIGQPIEYLATGDFYLVNFDTTEFVVNNIHIELLAHTSTPSAPIMVLDVPINFGPSTQIFNVIYTIGSGIFTESFFWTYAPIAHTYDYLDFGISAILGDVFYPIVPVRLDKVNIVDNPDQVGLYESASNLLRRININLDKFTEDLVNPSDPTALDDVDRGYLLFASDLNSSEPIALNYLYEYFKVLYDTAGVGQQTWIDAINAGISLPGRPTLRNGLHIQDLGIDITLWFNFITMRVVTGLIGGPLPAYDPMVLVPNTGPIDVGNAGLFDISKSLVIGTEIAGTNNRFYNDHVVILRKQITANTFVELVIHGLQHEMIVDKRANIIRRTPANMGDGGFFIPISRGTVRLFNGANESLVYYDSLVFLAYAIDVQKLAWYEQAAFLEAVAFVMIVVAIVYGAPELGAAISESFIAFMMYAAEVYIIGELVQAALGALVELVGGDVALILAAIAAVVAVYYGDGTQINGLLDSDTLLKLATLTIEAVNQNTQNEILELIQETEDYFKSAEELQTKIDMANDLLPDDINLDLYSLGNTSSYTDFNETPTEYFHRSIHLTNPGVLALDQIENYVSGALRLPDSLST